MIKQSDTDVPIRPWSDLSSGSLSNKSKNSKSRSYRYIQLERALISAKLLQTNDERIEFENEYFKSIQDKTFEKFLEKYYKKIQDHIEKLNQERELKQARIFTFIDLEKNFLTLDPTRDVKIIFVDEPTSSTITTTYIKIQLI